VRNKVKFIPLLAMLGLLAGAFGLMPAFADGETVEIRDADADDEISWIGVGGTIGLYVEDQDLNEALEDIDEVLDYTDEGGACLATGDLRVVQVLNYPIADRNGDGIVNFNDVVLGGAANADTTVNFVDGVNGSVTLRCAAAGGNVDQAVVYNGAELNDTALLVHVSSGADPVGFDITLVETDATSGEFTGSIVLTAANSVAGVSLKVADQANDTVEMVYDDDDSGDIKASVTVESREPSFSNATPDSGFAAQDREPVFEIDVSDGDSGIPEDSDDQVDATWVFRLTDLDGVVLPGLADNPLAYDANFGNVESIPGGWHLDDELPGPVIGFPDVDTYLVEWWVRVVDLAGNVGVTDEDADADNPCDTALFNIHLDLAVTGNCDPYIIRVDKDAPEVVNAVAGNSFDEDDEELNTGDDSSRTSVQVIFNEPLDGDTVILANFASSDVVITAVEWFDEGNIGAAVAGEPGCIRCSAFLTTEAMEPDLEPEITAKAEISDSAGNELGEDEDVDADDGMTAALTVAVTGTAAPNPVTDEEINIRITSDEDLVGTPSVVVMLVGDNTTLTGADLADANDVKIVDSDLRIWEIDIELSVSGLYNVYVTGIDTGALIESTEGEEGPVIDLDDANLFEVDTGVPDATFSPTNSTTNPNTFISINFSDEGSEYGLDADGVLSRDSADIDDNFDEHDKVTITAATLDGDDILAQINTEDNILYLYKASDLSLGEHELVLTVEDEAGNEVEGIEHAFDVDEPDLFEIDVNPGWNLLSIPGNPRDSSIDVIFTDNPDVTTVLTYDAGSQSWLVGNRAPGGVWSGTLTDITANRAYWINTASYKDVEVDVPGVAGGDQILPPTIQVYVGWNLLPVLDVTGAAAFGDGVSADSYMSELDWVKAYSFDTIGDSFDVVLPDQEPSDEMLVGNGYWVYFEKPGTLVP